jgi:hypothetical protein
LPPRARSRLREVALFTRRTESLSGRNETRPSFARVPFRTNEQLPSSSAADFRKRRGSLSMMARLPTSHRRGPNLALGCQLRARSASAPLRAGRPEAARGKDVDTLSLVLVTDPDIAWKRECKPSLWVDRVWSTRVPDTIFFSEFVISESIFSESVVSESAVERRSRCSQDRSYTRRFA